jgi:hypothetical protein
VQPSRSSNTGVPVPAWFPVLLFAAGTAVVLLAIGIIPVELEKITAPRWVILSAGLLFALGGLVMRLIPYRHEHPAWYMFTCALMCTTFFLVGAWAALYATGIKGSIGPVPLTEPTADWLGRAIFGLGALLLGFLSFYSWRQWWRAMHGEKIDLG